MNHQTQHLVSSLGIAIVISLLFVQSTNAFMESSNYVIDREVIGPAGDLGESANYQLRNSIGDPVANNQESSSYQVNEGYNYQLQANVPSAPTVSNPASYYNKLDFIVIPSNNPTDAEFAIAVSDDSFVTTKYIQTNDTLGDTMIWQTYANWGGASGETLLGLKADTTYSFKVKARHDEFTETGYGPTASVATADTSITFDIDIADGSHTNSDASYSVNLQELTSSTVTDEDTTSVSEIYIDLSGNAEDGTIVKVKSTNAGLSSSSTGDSISSSSTTLTTNTTNGGYGIAADENSAATAGTLTEVSPFNVKGTSAAVGAVTTAFQDIFNTGSAAITDGDGIIVVRAVAGKSTSAADDYTDILTFLAVPTY